MLPHPLTFEEFEQHRLLVVLPSTCGITLGLWLWLFDSFAHLLLQEKDILRKLKFRLNAATPYVFMLRLLKAAQADTRVGKNF